MRRELTRRAPVTRVARLTLVSLLLLGGCGGSGGGAGPSIDDVDGTPWVTVRLVASDADIANPERGFTGNAGDITAGTDALEREAAGGFRLVRSYIDLRAFIDRELDADFLAALGRGLDRARAAGVKLVLRFAYNAIDAEVADGDDTDAPIERVLAHIDQLAPVFAAHGDVIAFLEAGFVGAYGEWHGSSHGLEAEPLRSRIRDRLLAALPADRFVLMRDPLYLRQWFGTPLAPDDAFAPLAQARLGVHNDCFLAGNGDGNTYPDDDDGTLRAFTRATGRTTPFGGETCEEALDAARTGCADILSEGRDHAVTYLNGDYYRPAFHERWAAQGCLGEVGRRLGYRFVLDTVGHDAEVAAGAALTVRIAVRNLGWARLYNPRALVLRLTHVETGRTLSLPLPGLDPRDWLPQADDAAASPREATVVVPADAPPGRYAVGLALPDAAATLAGDARQAIRFANLDQPGGGPQWQAADGVLALGSTVTVR